MNFIKRAWLIWRQLKTWIQIVIVLVILSLIGAIGGSGSSSTVSEATSSPTNEPSSSASTAPSNEPIVEETPWYPSGFDEYQEGIAYKWSDGSCDFGTCVHAIFITRDGCQSSLYVEMNGFDKSSTQVDYTNDTTSSLAPMKKAKMTFNFMEDSVSKAGVSKVSCY